MRRVRTLVAGTAIAFAALTVAAPAAFAEDAPAPPKPENGASAPENGSHEKTWTGDHKATETKDSESKSSEHKGYEAKGSESKSVEDKGGEGGHEGKSWKDHKSPHGGVHTGIGGAFLDNGAGLATGAALIAGGVGLGVYALRRRTSTVSVAAQA